MPSTLEILLKTKGVLSARQVTLTAQIKSLLGEKLSERAARNARQVHVYVFRYKSNGHAVSGFLIEPKKVKGALPCIVHNRGGYKDFGLVKTGKLFLERAEMARWGYVVIGSQYSGNSLSEGKDEYGGSDVEDIVGLYKVLKSLPHADEKRVGMYAGSRGGLMAYQCLTCVRWIRGAVVVAGLANLVRSEKLRPEMKSVYKEAFGGSLKEKKKRSAVYWSEKFPKNVPLLLMHGTADWRVSPLDSFELAQKLYEHKVPHRLVMFEGSDHGLTEHYEEHLRLTREWMDRFVKEKGTLPDLHPHGI